MLRDPVVLELVHLSELGVSALTLEGVRQERERRMYLDRRTHTSSSAEGQELRPVDLAIPYLEPYPRRRLKLFLSDGRVELQAIELERLNDVKLGTTPMGTKVRYCILLTILILWKCSTDTTFLYSEDLSEECRNHRRNCWSAKRECDGHGGVSPTLAKATSSPALRGAG